MSENAGAPLRVEDLRVRLGGVRVLDGVRLEVNPGELVGLVGPNGAGKTVLLDCVCGLAPAESGRVLLCGEDVTHAPAFWRARRGLSRTFQEGRLLGEQTVSVNVALAVERSPGGFISDALSLPWSVRGRSRALRRAREVLELVGLKDAADEDASSLGEVDRRLLEIARALASQPRILLLDEPGAGIEPGSYDMGSLVLRLRDELRIGVLLVEHDPALIFSVCDFVYVLDSGRMIASGPPLKVQRDPLVLETYLGVA